MSPKTKMVFVQSRNDKRCVCIYVCLCMTVNVALIDCQLITVYGDKSFYFQIADYVSLLLSNRWHLAFVIACGQCVSQYLKMNHKNKEKERREL